MTAQTQATGPADAIFINANVYAGARLAAGPQGALSAQVLPAAQAIAVKDGRVLATGSDAEIKKLKRKHTQVVDLGGRFIMPGFNDAHLHMALGGFKMLDVDLGGVASLAEMQQRIADKVKTSAPGEWIKGRGWDHTKWADQKLPTRQDLDTVSNGHPAIFVRVDGHIAVANTAALQMAGITKTTRAPQGGQIDLDANGELTGILRERATMDLVNTRIPVPPLSRRRQAIELALKDAAQHGLTSLQDSALWEDFLVYEDLEREGKLTARIYAWMPFNTQLDVLEQHRAHHPANDPMLRFGMLKGYMDGSLGSRTAALLQPYSDDPKNSGLPQYEPVQLQKMADERAAAGFQMGFHAIGDRGAQLALDAFEGAQRYVREHSPTQTGTPLREFRFRIEHDQVITPEQFAQFRKLGVVASMQPNHLLTDMNWAEARIGPERAKTSYPWKQFLTSGVLLAFGTDYPVEPLTPFRGVYAAVTRQNEAGNKSYYVEQKLTIHEALAAYTYGAAFAEFAEREKGTLEPGMLADFIVLDRDLTRAQPQEILRTNVLRTVVGGRTVFEAKTTAGD
jgi:predicted amidohydrolase YtcJ